MKLEYLDNIAIKPNRCLQEILLNDHHCGLWYNASYKNFLSPLIESWEIYISKDENNNEEWKYFDNENDFEQFISQNKELINKFKFRSEGISEMNGSIVGHGKNKSRIWQLDTNSDYWHTNKYNMNFDDKINQSLQFRFCFMAKGKVNSIPEFKKGS